MKFSFEDLGKRINETVETLSSKTEEAVEIQKLKNQIRGLEKENQNDLARLGRKVYEQFKAGEMPDEDSAAICEAVSGREADIAEYKQKVMGMKGDSHCESCGKTVAKGMTYCPYCGAKVPETEPTEDDFADETMDYTDYTGEVKDMVSDTAEKVVGMAKEAAGKAAGKVSDAVDIVSEKVSKAAEAAKDKTEGVVDAAEVIIEDVREEAGEAMNNVKETVSEAAEKVKETADETVEEVKEDVKDAVKDAEE